MYPIGMAEGNQVSKSAAGISSVGRQRWDRQAMVCLRQAESTAHQSQYGFQASVGHANVSGHLAAAIELKLEPKRRRLRRSGAPHGSRGTHDDSLLHRRRRQVYSI